MTQIWRRKSSRFLAFIAGNLLLVCLAGMHAWLERGRQQPYLDEKARLVAEFGLTDLSLFTDARYTRHPSMADLNTPFQDSPLSLDHFPSGTIVGPPPHLRQSR